jgi:Trypsin-like peptidase domain
VQVQTVAEQLFFTTVFVSAVGPDGSSWSGTGFIHGIEVEEGTLHLLVTNKHVLHGASEITFRMIRGTANNLPDLGHATEMTVRGLPPDAWQGHADDEVDVAVFPLGAVMQRMASNGAPPFFRSVASEQLASEELLSEIDALEQVTFVGYPSGLYDRSNYLPIARRGMTATPVVVDYNGLPAFLIDASVFPGSSGSPVFLADRGLHTSRDGGTILGNPRFALLGVLAAVHMREVAGKIVELPAQLGIVVPEVLDLGIVFRAEAITAAADALIARLGLSRKQAPLSADLGELTAVDQEVAHSLPLAEPE